MENNEDRRTLADLARESLQVQNACNLSGVAFGFGRAVVRLRAVLPQAGNDAIARHPVCQLWSDKIASLTGTQFGSLPNGQTYQEVERLAAGGPENG